MKLIVTSFCSSFLENIPMGNETFIQFSSVAQSCPTLCDTMDCSTPGFPVPHHLLEFTQVHVHWTGNAIQPSYPLSSPSSLWINFSSVVVQLLSCVWLFVTPWTAAHQASMSFTISRSLLKLMSIESVMSSHLLILCHPLLLLPSIFPSMRVLSNELSLHIR